MGSDSRAPRSKGASGALLHLGVGGFGLARPTDPLAQMCIDQARELVRLIHYCNVALCMRCYGEFSGA